MKPSLFVAQEDEWLTGAIDDSHRGVEPLRLTLCKRRFSDRSRQRERQVSLHHDALRVRVNTGCAKEPERDCCRRRPCHVAPPDV
jgi:hypothetical protein